MNKYWNGKLFGLIWLLLKLIERGFRKILNNIFSLIVRISISSCGKNTQFKSGLYIAYPGNVSIGNNVKIGENVKFTSEVSNSNLKIGSDVIIGDGVHIDYSGGVIIFNNVTISENVLIETHDHGMNPRSNPTFSSLEIHANVWIAARSTILHKVKYIGKGSIVAAGAILTSDIDDNLIYAGIPAKMIKRIT